MDRTLFSLQNFIIFISQSKSNFSKSIYELLSSIYNIYSSLILTKNNYLFYAINKESFSKYKANCEPVYKSLS